MTDEMKLSELLQRRGFQWAVDNFHPSDEAARHYLARLTAIQDVLSKRSLKSGPTIEGLLKIEQSHGFKLDAFLEAIATLRTPQMGAAVWRMLQGMELKELDLRYRRGEAFELGLSLETPYGETEGYQTDDIDDMTFVRNLMKSKSGDRPIINGYFALRRSKS